MNMFARQGTMCEQQTGLNILRFQVRMFLQDDLYSVSGSKLGEDVFHCDAHVADDGFPTNQKNLEVQGNRYQALAN